MSQTNLINEPVEGNLIACVRCAEAKAKCDRKIPCTRCVDKKFICRPRVSQRRQRKPNNPKLPPPPTTQNINKTPIITTTDTPLESESNPAPTSAENKPDTQTDGAYIDWSLSLSNFKTAINQWTMSHYRDRTQGEYRTTVDSNSNPENTNTNKNTLPWLFPTNNLLDFSAYAGNKPPLNLQLALNPRKDVGFPMSFTREPGNDVLEEFM